MQTTKWREKLGDLVRELFLSPEMDHFYSLKITPERARLYILQLGIYIRQRRNYWPQVAANCPEFDVKQKILNHEYEELVEDEYSSAGHLDLVIRQGRQVGLSQEEVLKAEPLPTTQAAIYGWWWIARHRPWQEQTQHDGFKLDGPAKAGRRRGPHGPAEAGHHRRHRRHDHRHRRHEDSFSKGIARSAPTGC